jgi:hypothetical protein
MAKRSKPKLSPNPRLAKLIKFVVLVNKSFFPQPLTREAIVRGLMNDPV